MVSLPSTYAIVDLDSNANPFMYIELLFDAGVRLIQLRTKKQLPSQFVELATSAVALANAKSQSSAEQHLIIINDFVEMAKEVRAHGVHLGQDDLAILEAREFLGPNFIIGLSTHNAGQIITANSLPVDYVGLGPIFLSNTKQGHADVVGLEGLEHCARIAKHPIVAIGGITEKHVPEVFAAGAISVAMIQGLAQSKDLGQTIKTIEVASKNVRTTQTHR